MPDKKSYNIPLTPRQHRPPKEVEGKVDVMAAAKKVIETHRDVIKALAKR